MSGDCLHGFDAPAHGETWDCWARLLAAAHPGEYEEPPLPGEAANVLTRQARVAVYEARERAGLGLFHPGDLWRPENADGVKVAAVAANGRNGAPVRKQVLKSRV